MPEFSYIELACKKLEVDPDSILSFHEYDDQLAIITAEGKKFVFTFEELKSKSVQNIAAGNIASERATSPAKSGGMRAASNKKSKRVPTTPNKLSERVPTPAETGGAGAAANEKGRVSNPAQAGGVRSRSKRGTGLPYFQSGRTPTPIQTTKKDAAIEKEPIPADDSDPAAPAAGRRKIRRPKAPNVSQEGPQER